MCWYLIAVSFLSLLIPSGWLQLSQNPKFYVKAGARFIRKFVQNGDWFKNDTPVISNRFGAMQYKATIIMYERFHFLCLVFFILTSIYALIHQQYVIALLVFLANMIYNVCPIILQQYNFSRLLNIGKRML
ncbi:hypothetical protein [Mucilaginibacter gynuensis]